MQTPFEMAWLILKQGKVGRIDSDSLMSHRHVKPPLDPTRGSTQYKQRGMLDRAYAGRGTPPPPPRDTSLDEFTDKLEFDINPTAQQAYEAKLPIGGLDVGQTTYRNADKIPPQLLGEAFPSATEFGGKNMDENLKFYSQHGLPPVDYNQGYNIRDMHEDTAFDMRDLALMN
jgi:hypothetical protein